MSTVSVDVRDGVAVVTLDRPEARNAISLELARDLDEATRAVEKEARAVVVRGNGPAFCVGGDLKSFIAQPDIPGHLRAVTGHMHPVVSRLASMDAVVVAAVHGAAAGAGMSLALAADIVLAASSARFTAAFTRVGLSPDSSMTWFLPRLVGRHRALDLLLTNRVLGADEALELGLVTRVVADEELVDQAMTTAGTLADGPTRAFGRTKRLLNDSLRRDLDAQLEAERDAIADSAGEDGPEGVAAFVEKREPRFR